MTTEFISSEPKDSALNSQWPAQQSAWAKSFEAFCRTVFKIYCPLSSFGTHNLPKVPYLICSNHASHLDSAMLMVAAHVSFQKIGLIAAKDYFFDQQNRMFLRYMMNLVPIARGGGSKGVRESIIACRSFLNSGGEVLIIYPEGTRSLNHKIARFKEGAAILAHDLNLPMVPALVVGSGDSLPKGSFFLKPRKLTVSFGQPLKVTDFLAPHELEDRKAVFRAYRDATAEIERRVRDLNV
jgi:1-acyl-sn-glycerol-3-phosphate acyltransferase